MSIQATVDESASQTIAASELSERINGGRPVTVVDVRTVGEFRAGHVAGALSIPMDEIESRLADLPKGAEIVLTCLSGDRATMTHGILQDKIAGVTCLRGGMEAWENAGLPMVHVSRTRMAIDRQAMIGASAIILLSVALGTFVSPKWFYLALVPGVGLMMAGAAGICLMGIMLTKMPWNKSRK